MDPVKGDSQADIDIRALSERCHRLEDENQRLRALLTEKRHRPSGCASRSKAANAIFAIAAQYRAADCLVPVVVSRTRGCLRPAVGESGWPVRLLAKNGTRLESLLRGQTGGSKTS